MTGKDWIQECYETNMKPPIINSVGDTRGSGTQKNNAYNKGLWKGLNLAKEYFLKDKREKMRDYKRMQRKNPKFLEKEREYDKKRREARKL